MPSDAMIEAAARAMCEARGIRPDECMHGNGSTNPPSFKCDRYAWQDKIVEARAALTAALAQGVGVAVRELEWEYHERQMYTYVASDDRGMMYHINQAFGSDSYYFATVRFDGKILYDGDDLPSAKAAAQSDYEQRIRSALVASPPREELERVTRERDEAAKDRDDLCAALGFKPGPLAESRQIILGDASGLRPAMVDARRKLQDAECDAMNWWLFVQEGESSLLKRVWEQRQEFKKRALAAESQPSPALREGTMMLSEADEIVKRRFGSRHEKPCNNPRTLTCARWECQVANECRESPLVGKWRHDDEAGRRALKEQQ